MEITYKRDGNQNYMVLERLQSAELSYQEKMFLNAKLSGLLVGCLRSLNGQGMYYYDIHSRQPLSVLFEHKRMSGEELRSILFALANLFETLSNHLLSVRFLLLAPECIYMSPSGKEVSFCFYPDYQKECRDSFLELSEFFTRRIDYSDECAKELAYQYDKNVSEEKFDPSELLKDYELPEESGVSLEELLWEDKSAQGENYYHAEVASEDFTEEEIKLPHTRLLIVCGVLILLAAGLYLCALLNPTLLSFLRLSQQDYIIAGAVIASLFGGMIPALVKVVCYWRRGRADREEADSSSPASWQASAVDEIEETEYLERGKNAEEGCAEMTLLSENQVSDIARLTEH